MSSTSGNMRSTSKRVSLGRLEVSSHILEACKSSSQNRQAVLSPQDWNRSLNEQKAYPKTSTPTAGNPPESLHVHSNVVLNSKTPRSFASGYQGLSIFFPNVPSATSASLSRRRASCEPEMLYTHTKLTELGAQGKCPQLSTRFELAPISLNSPSEEATAHRSERRRSFGQIQATSLLTDHLSLKATSFDSSKSSCIQPSLSPCLEDASQESHFAFSRNSFLGTELSLLIEEYQRPPRICKSDFRKGYEVSPRTLKLRRSSFTCLPSTVAVQETVPLNIPKVVVFDSNNNDINELTFHSRSFDAADYSHVLLGKGGFGKVFACSWKGKRCAVKFLKGERACSSIVHEMNALDVPWHPYLVKTSAVITHSKSLSSECTIWEKTTNGRSADVSEMKELLSSLRKATSEECHLTTSNTPWALIVSELCTQFTVLTVINSNQDLSSIKKTEYMGEVASALVYLHQLKLVHLDVKPSNALLTSNGHVKLGDFGCCSEIKENKDGEIGQVLGTVAYQSPEVLRGNRGTEKSDIYSFGIFLWHMLTRISPYEGLHPHIIIYQVTRLNYRPIDHQMSSYDGDKAHKNENDSELESLLHKLAQKCWSASSVCRPTAHSLYRSLSEMYCTPVKT